MGRVDLFKTPPVGRTGYVHPCGNSFNSPRTISTRQPIRASTPVPISFSNNSNYRLSGEIASQNNLGYKPIVQVLNKNGGAMISQNKSHLINDKMNKKDETNILKQNEGSQANNYTTDNKITKQLITGLSSKLTNLNIDCNNESQDEGVKQLANFIVNYRHFVELQTTQKKPISGDSSNKSNDEYDDEDDVPAEYISRTPDRVNLNKSKTRSQNQPYILQNKQNNTAVRDDIDNLFEIDPYSLLQSCPPELFEKLMQEFIASSGHFEDDQIPSEVTNHSVSDSTSSLPQIIQNNADGQISMESGELSYQEDLRIGNNDIWEDLLQQLEGTLNGYTNDGQKSVPVIDADRHTIPNNVFNISPQSGFTSFPINEPTPVQPSVTSGLLNNVTTFNTSPVCGQLSNQPAVLSRDVNLIQTSSTHYIDVSFNTNLPSLPSLNNLDISSTEVKEIYFNKNVNGVASPKQSVDTFYDNFDVSSVSSVVLSSSPDSGVSLNSPPYNSDDSLQSPLKTDDNSSSSMFSTVSKTVNDENFSSAGKSFTFNNLISEPSFSSDKTVKSNNIGLMNGGGIVSSGSNNSFSALNNNDTKTENKISNVIEPSLSYANINSCSLKPDQISPRTSTSKNSNAEDESTKVILSKLLGKKAASDPELFKGLKKVIELSKRSCSDADMCLKFHEEFMKEINKSSLLGDFLIQLGDIFGDKHKESTATAEDLSYLKEIWPHKLMAIILCLLDAGKEKMLYQPETRSKLNWTPLQVAAIFNYKEPLIARCIADCMIIINVNPDMKTVFFDGEKLHLLEQLKRAGRQNVIEELVKVKNRKGLPVFTLPSK